MTGLNVKVANLDALEDMLDLQVEVLKEYVKDPQVRENYRKRLVKIVGRLLMDEYEAAYNRDYRAFEHLQS